METQFKIAQLIFAAALLIVKSGFSQVCYPTSLIDNAHGGNISITYDDQLRPTSVTSNIAQSNIIYSITTETTPDGYKRIFSLKEGNSQMMDFIPNKMAMVYDKSNRLLLMESWTGSSTHETDKFIYNANNQLMTINKDAVGKDPQGKVITDRGRILYAYPNTQTQNPSEVKIFGTVNDKPELKLVERDLLTYDNNKTVPNVTPFPISIFKIYPTNNVITAEITQYTLEPITIKQSYSYTFNENGYPITCSYQFSGSPNTDTFAYACK
jgi:hypothetical protein